MSLDIERALTTVNFRVGRPLPIDQLTIHVTEGDEASVRSWFNTPGSDANAHYLVCKDGRRVQFVEESNQAYHNGRVFAPTAPLVLERPGVNPNQWSIGIEHEGSGTEEMTEPQRQSSLALALDIVRRNPLIKINRRHIVRHSEVYAHKTCPGKISVDRYVAQLAALAMVGARPAAPKVVWSDFFTDWLVVTREISDTEWYFVPLKDISKAPQTRAQTPLSRMVSGV